MLGILPTTLLVVLIAAILAVVLVVVLVPVRRHPWTGFQDKKLWDWMKLLIVPFAILVATAGATAILSYFENEREHRRAVALLEAENKRADALLEAENTRADALREADRKRADALLKAEIERGRVQQQIEEDRVRQTLLQSYIRDISGLLLHERLVKPSPGSSVRQIARASTLTTLRQLDSDRKAILLQFLFGSNLLKRPEDTLGNAELNLLDGADLSSVELSSADLSGADLSGADLSSTNLNCVIMSNQSICANLSGAQLNRAHLNGAQLNGAHLNGAQLAPAYLNGANLNDADLNGANLIGSHLIGSHLIGAKLRCVELNRNDDIDDFRCANLADADLNDADLTGANLFGAWGSAYDQLARAKSLLGATLPNGTIIKTQDDWETFKRRYRQ